MIDYEKKLTALSLCLTLSDDPTDNPCKRCPLYECDPFEQPAMARDLLSSFAPNDDRASRLVSILDYCMEYDEEVCAESCPYYDRCQNENILIILHDVYDFLKEAGAYDQIQN